MVQVSNTNMTNYSNVNFKSLKSVKVGKLLKNEYPKQAEEILHHFENNPNVQDFLKNYDAKLFIDLIKSKYGFSHVLKLTCINPLGENSVLKKIQNFFSGSKKFQIKHETKLSNQNSTKELQTYLDKNSKYEVEHIQVDTREVGKMSFPIYKTISLGDKNINQDLQSLKKDIAHEKESIALKKQKKAETLKKREELLAQTKQRKSEIPNEQRSLDEQIRKMIQ